MILCAGESLVDMLPRDTSDGPGFLPVPGGAVLNTAVALGRLGAPVAFHSGLSTDLLGARITRHMVESGVEDRAARSDRPTTLAFVTLREGQAEYAFYDENTAGRLLSPADAPSMAGVDTLFLGGISLAVEPCAEAYEALAAHGLPLMIDPNIRSGFAPDETRYRDRLRRLVARAQVVKLSDEDMAHLGTTPAEVLAAGPHTVLLTEGARGATAITARGAVHVPAPRVDVVDTVGAGDTFDAGCLAALHRSGGIAEAPDDDRLRAALDLGVRAAAVAVSRAGADPPWEREL